MLHPLALGAQPRARDCARSDPLQARGGSTRARAAFLEVAAPHLKLSSFKRLTAEEREDLEEMKTSRFEREAEEHENRDHREHKAGAAADGDNGAAVPLPGFLTAVPGVSSVASSSYALSAYEYAKENPMMTAWTVGTAAFSAAASAFRSVYDYFYPPQDEGWFGGWDAGLLSGGAAAAGGWFGSASAPSSSSWFGGGAAASSDASVSSGGWFGFGSAAPAAAGAGGAAAGAAGGAAAGGWFGGLFGGSSGEDKGQADQFELSVWFMCVGVGRWLLQACLVAALACAVCVAVLILLLSESLVLFIVTLSVSGCLFASMKFCLRPWAWLGVDSHLPILFDLQSSGLEVGTWDHCFLRRKTWPAAALRDLRVYKETVDSLGESADSEPVPISSSQKVSAELPQCCDATKACFGSCWRSCCSGGSGGFLVSGVFLGAKVESKVVRLTRDVWTLKEVEQLLVLAQQGRQLLGLPEQAPADLERASEQVQVVDVECIPVTCVMGKEDGLPTIREDTILRDSTEASVLPMFSKETSEVADERCMPTVRSGALAPRPKTKSQAKVQDLLAV
ncbi:unnamed protein product [Symbiodinium sp. CCMP2592]|nr:unnamed protein product [Symbiodinium sp. CCMP2592]